MLLSEVVSPLSLAASTRVDSSFSSLSLSSLSLGLHFDTLQLYLLHSPRRSADNPVAMFDGYRVIGDRCTASGSTPRCHELLKLSISDLGTHLRLLGQAAVELKVPIIHVAQVLCKIWCGEGGGGCV